MAYNSFTIPDNNHDGALAIVANDPDDVCAHIQTMLDLVDKSDGDTRRLSRPGGLGAVTVIAGLVSAR